MVRLALRNILWHGAGWDLLCDSLEEKSTPCHDGRLGAESWSKVELCPLAVKSEGGTLRTYESSMLVSLEDNVQHLARLLTVLVQQLLSNDQQTWEGRLNNLVKVLSSITALESEHSADRQKTLKSGKDGAWVGGVEEV